MRDVVKGIVYSLTELLFGAIKAYTANRRYASRLAKYRRRKPGVSK